MTCSVQKNEKFGISQMYGNGYFNKNYLFFIADCLYVLGLWGLRYSGGGSLLKRSSLLSCRLLVVRRLAFDATPFILGLFIISDCNNR
jgi:hypothetical protein